MTCNSTKWYLEIGTKNKIEQNKHPSYSPKMNFTDTRMKPGKGSEFLVIEALHLGMLCSRLE